ncbi:dihydroorotate dehydrogenase 2 [Kluyveromyces lactis]|uniref:Dihydroorotate dehydrogenase (quinone), mitochondrial n=1 Tax=Kluyveromyces lactis (strain ATCC 8585 / CBS 2359 / DSM 70799 / NBRC 1267 / NRRL Y-1140 / WM37) TaxID=284590 RepID=PYRD2_KLULA|nr:uncharacterized protein KLLA0_C09240g [Kluyveromyces lactis]Q6CTX8.1 RecName: Full=Dihydroorotate dehydrogenase (quinone), mitochondrial; Short=DHOD; Short=DHODase; Short=DHOdehase; AltName: Full=Dihydroorotate oxidase; Flags: Precursor [Kluyveromyces lactis NRRL Y-1140]CAH01462.1 KLLA0C09240p [Kluyveromyces lactis]|eukprot:XP_452611.1 uncharacterized protein KLLA0_C09240g [Kluyveromyces lactis]
MNSGFPRILSKKLFTLNQSQFFVKNGMVPLKAGISGPKLLKYTVGIAIGSFAGFYFSNSRSAFHEYVLCPMLRLVTPDAEDGHKLGIWFLKNGLAPRLWFDNDDKVLNVNIFGKKLTNPIGCAAGLDKNGDAIDGILSGGFGYIEIGSVTPLPQPGNPRPRFFRLPLDDAVINRYGFNSSGHDTVVNTLQSRITSFINSYMFKDNSVENLSLYKDKLLGVNLGKNKTGDEVQDYLKGVESFQKYADVLVINVSSPNTPGLRSLQKESILTDLLTQVVAKRDSLVTSGNALGAKTHKPPVLVKVAPDLVEEEIKSIAEAAKKSKVDGIIISNTTIQRPTTLITEDSDLVSQAGGLSGKPLKPLALKALKTMAKYTKGSGLVLVGCGGISSGADAIEFAKAGASMVELYTAYAYKGPGLIAKIKDETTELLKKENKTWSEIIGEDIK